MRLVLLFAPAFWEWPKEMMRIMAKERPDIEIIGFAANKRVYKDLQEAEDLKFAKLYDFEALEYEWLDSPADLKKLDAYEKELGAGFIQRLVIADRYISAGHIPGAPHVRNEFYDRTRDHDIVQRYMVNMLDFVTGFFNEYKPNSFMTYAVASAWMLACGDLAPSYNCKFYHFCHSRIGDNYILDTTTTGNLIPVQEIFMKAQEDPKILALWRDKAKKWLRDFYAADTMPAYASYNRQQMFSQNRWGYVIANVMRTAAKAILYPFVIGKRPLRGPGGFTKLYHSIVYPFRWRYDVKVRKYAGTEKFKDKKFIYFPLHVDPETSTMVYAPKLTNQLTVIEALAKSAPLSMPIIVKDHQTMLGRRPAQFYKRISEFQNVHLVSPFENSKALVRQAALTVTITGTVVWEALLYKKPAIIMGASPYEVIHDGFVYCSELSALDQAIQAALKLDPVNEDKLVDYIAAVYSASFPSSTDLLWGAPSFEKVKANMPLTRKFLDKLYSEMDVCAAQKTDKLDSRF